MRQLILDLETETQTESRRYIEDRDFLKERLYCNGSIGLDLSPGDPIALAAYHTICALENQVELLKQQTYSEHALNRLL